MADERKRLDLIQRYAERMGGAETNIAEFLAPPTSETIARIGPQTGLEAAAAPVSRVEPAPLQVHGASRPQKEARPQKAADRGGRVQIDLERLERSGCIVPQGDKKTQLEEHFQIIKRPLIQKAFAPHGAVRNGNLVMVTSAKPGEGKSFVALNLAMSIASERDLFVMLLDSDFYNPSLPSMLGVQIEKGLVDVLLDESLDIADVLLRTNIPNLTLLPAGRKHPHSTELLSSQRMSRLMREIVSRYANRIIIVDSPPVLASNEAGVMASHVGQIVMVVEQNRTGWRLVERSLARLSECADISLVLNKVEPIWGDRLVGAYR